MAAQLCPRLVGVEGAFRFCLLLPHLFQFRKHSVRSGAGVPQDALGFGLAPAAGVFLGPLHLLPELPRLAGVLFPLAVQPVCLLLPLFQCLPLFFQLGQHILKPHAVPAHLGLRVRNHLVRQAQPPGDGKGVGLAGDSDQQPVGRAESLHVELAGGVFHPHGGHGKGFQLRIVGGGGGFRPQCPDVLDDGDGQCRALNGVCTGTQFVKENQAVPIRLL